MSDATDDLTAAIGALEGRKFIREDQCADEAAYAAAAKHNIDLMSAFAGAHRLLLSKVESLNNDRSAGAIWRRAYRRSIETRDDPNRAVKSRRWKAKAINLNPKPLHNAMALSGMCPIQVDEKWLLAVAIPQPAPFGDMGYDVEDIITIDPDTGVAALMFDRGATHYAPPPSGDDRITVMSDAKAWARSIALERLEWCRLRAQRAHAIQAEPTWPRSPSAALLLAKPAKVRWSDFDAKILDVPAELRRDVQRAVMAQARLPRIEGRA